MPRSTIRGSLPVSAAARPKTSAACPGSRTSSTSSPTPPIRNTAKCCAGMADPIIPKTWPNLPPSAVSASSPAAASPRKPPPPNGNLPPRELADAYRGSCRGGDANTGRYRPCPRRLASFVRRSGCAGVRRRFPPRSWQLYRQSRSRADRALFNSAVSRLASEQVFTPVSLLSAGMAPPVTVPHQCPPPLHHCAGNVS